MFLEGRMLVSPNGWDSGDITLSILNIGTKWKSVVSFTILSPKTPGNGASFNRCLGREKNFCTFRESNYKSSTVQHVAKSLYHWARLFSLWCGILCFVVGFASPWPAIPSALFCDTPAAGNQKKVVPPRFQQTCHHFLNLHLKGIYLHSSSRSRKRNHLNSMFSNRNLLHATALRILCDL